MKKIVSVLLFISFFILSVSARATQAHSEGKDTKWERLRRGEVVSDGGYLETGGVWGRMEAFIEAPPRVIWRLFLAANDWNRYGLPSLADSRTVTEEIGHLSSQTENIHDVYHILSGRVFDPFANQKPGAQWINYALQHYDLPWPVKNRWMILKNTNDESRSLIGTYRTDWVKVAGNVKTVTGGVTLQAVAGEPEMTYLTYHVESNPGSSVPKFILKWGVRRSMPAAIRVIRREAARIYGKPARYLPNTSQLRK